MAKRFIPLLVLATHHWQALTVGGDRSKETLDPVLGQCCSSEPERLPEDSGDSTTHSVFAAAAAVIKGDSAAGEQLG